MTRDPKRRFFFLFVLITSGLLVLELLAPIHRAVVLPWTALLAKFCASLVTLLDPNAYAYQNILFNSQSNFGVAILPGCNGVEAMVVLFAAVMAFPSASLWEKVVGFLVGSLVVQALNVVRIISLYYLGQWHLEVFEWAHLYLWPILIMLDVFVVWIFWTRSVARRRAAA